MVDQPSIDAFVAFAHTLADAAAEVTMPWFRADAAIENKREADFDPVTVADQDAEAAMRALIEATYPDHGILGEEHGHKPAGDSGHMWVLDPIDGTRSFIGGFPTWGTLIALHDGSKPIVGIMDQPFTGERFVGSPSGVVMGDRELKVRDCATLADAVLYSTTPDMFKGDYETRAFGDVEAAVKLRRFGGDCYAYAMLAMGQLDLVVESSMQAYDIQALIPIVEGAGGIVTTWDGGPADNGGRLIAAGDRRVYDEAMALLQP